MLFITRSWGRMGTSQGYSAFFKRLALLIDTRSSRKNATFGPAKDDAIF